MYSSGQTKSKKITEQIENTHGIFTAAVLALFWILIFPLALISNELGSSNVRNKNLEKETTNQMWLSFSGKAVDINVISPTYRFVNWVENLKLIDSNGQIKDPLPNVNSDKYDQDFYGLCSEITEEPFGSGYYGCLDDGTLTKSFIEKYQTAKTNFTDDFLQYPSKVPGVLVRSLKTVFAFSTIIILIGNLLIVLFYSTGNDYRYLMTSKSNSWMMLLCPLVYIPMFGYNKYKSIDRSNNLISAKKLSKYSSFSRYTDLKTLHTRILQINDVIKQIKSNQNSSQEVTRLQALRNQYMKSYQDLLVRASMDSLPVSGNSIIEDLQTELQEINQRTKNYYDVLEEISKR